MQSMIRSMTVEQKEELMLKMMPEMMKKSNPQILIPNMLKETSKIISLYSIYELIYKIVNDKELNKSINSYSKKVKDKFMFQIPTFFEMMKPIALKVLPKIMSVFKPMMPGMMIIMEDENLVKEIPPEVKQEMAKCMGNVMPVWLDSLHPLIAQDQKNKFNEKVVQIVAAKN